MTRKELKAQIKAHPEFASWVKAKPDLYKKIKNDPKAAEDLFGTWKKAQTRKEGIKKLAENYRSMVDQIQELHSLLQRVDSLVNNVKNMSQAVGSLDLKAEQTAKEILHRPKGSSKKG